MPKITVTTDQGIVVDILPQTSEDISKLEQYTLPKVELMTTLLNALKCACKMEQAEEANREENEGRN